MRGNPHKCCFPWMYRVIGEKKKARHNSLENYSRDGSHFLRFDTDRSLLVWVLCKKNTDKPLLATWRYSLPRKIFFRHIHTGFHAIFIINYIWAMSDRISLPIPKCTQQTRPFRSHSFNPPRTAPGSHRSRRTLSLPAREKPMIPPMIAESPESLRRSHDRYSSTEQSIQENVYEISWFAPIFGLLASIILFAWACALSISSHEMKKWFREKELRQSNTFLIDKTIPFIMYLLCWKRSAKPRQISACWNIVGVFLWYSTLKTSEKCFHVTSRHVGVSEQWWFPQRILLELNYILMLRFPLVLFEKTCIDHSLLLLVPLSFLIQHSTCAKVPP